MSNKPEKRRMAPPQPIHENPMDSGVSWLAWMKIKAAMMLPIKPMVVTMLGVIPILIIPLMRGLMRV